MVSGAAEMTFDAVRGTGVDFYCLFPCDKARRLYDIVAENSRHIVLSREEEGVGICAGASLAGMKSAMLVQSSGMGNMMNALCSLTKAYHFPLPILVSWRGVYKERIPAQVPLGKGLPKVLRALDIEHTVIRRKEDLTLIQKAVSTAFAGNTIRVILLSPAIWEADADTSQNPDEETSESKHSITLGARRDIPQAVLTRFEILKLISAHLENKVVVCNLGIPCKELFFVKHQKSNFYMLGSMGLASSIGLGISLFTSKQVVVIEGDGSLLTNLGSLSTIAAAEPRNLSVLAIDNGVHGSTGNQPTATRLCVDLEATARGLGFQKTYRAASGDEIRSTIENLGDGPSFVHLIAKPGNANVSDVPLSPLRIRRNVKESLRE